MWSSPALRHRRRLLYMQDGSCLHASLLSRVPNPGRYPVGRLPGLPCYSIPYSRYVPVDHLRVCKHLIFGFPIDYDSACRLTPTLSTSFMASLWTSDSSDSTTHLSKREHHEDDPLANPEAPCLHGLPIVHSSLPPITVGNTMPLLLWIIVVFAAVYRFTSWLSTKPETLPKQ